VHDGARNRMANRGLVQKKFGKGDEMTDTTSNPGSDAFRKFAFVLMVVLIAFGVLELAGVVKV
jgi:hypothetical protein